MPSSARSEAEANARASRESDRHRARKGMDSPRGANDHRITTYLAEAGLPGPRRTKSRSSSIDWGCPPRIRPPVTGITSQPRGLESFIFETQYHFYDDTYLPPPPPPPSRP